MKTNSVKSVEFYTKQLFIFAICFLAVLSCINGQPTIKFTNSHFSTVSQVSFIPYISHPELAMIEKFFVT